MNRAEKIKFLRAIQAGKMSIGDFLPPKLFLSVRREDQDGIEFNGTKITDN
jgi:hypothetical protein